MQQAYRTMEYRESKVDYVLFGILAVVMAFLLGVTLGYRTKVSDAATDRIAGVWLEKQEELNYSPRKK